MNLSEEELKKKASELSIKEGSFYSIMDGMGLRYITPFALALGASNKQIGFLTSLPSMIGNFSKIFTPRYMEKTSRKKIIVYGTLLQALMWLVLLLIGYFYFSGKISGSAAVLVIIAYTLLILFGAFTSPAWSSWMKDIVTVNSGKYFGRRSKITGFIALLAMLIGGFILDYFNKSQVFIGFVILFVLAFFGRFVSSMIFRKKYEPKLHLEQGYYFSFGQFLRKMPNNFGNFVIFLTMVQLATAIASPFFTVYMLKDLGFGYVSWILVNMIAPLVTLVFLTGWGKFADKYGNLRVMRICGFLTPLIPLFYLFSIWLIPFGHYVVLIYLIAVEAFSGFAWAGFNLSSSNFIYDAVTRERMALCVAYSDILNGIGIFLGATLGGFISGSNFIIFGLTPILFVFLISFVARFLAATIFLPRIKEVRDVEKFDIKGGKKILMDIGIGRIAKQIDMVSKPGNTD